MPQEKTEADAEKRLKNLKKMSTTFASNISSDKTEKTTFFDWAQEHHKGERSSLPLCFCLDDLARLILQTRPDQRRKYCPV